MQEAVAPVARAHGAILEVMDVDAQPALEATWGDLVPVLFLGAPQEGKELCHYRYDSARVSAALGPPGAAALAPAPVA